LYSWQRKNDIQSEKERNLVSTTIDEHVNQLSTDSQAQNTKVFSLSMKQKKLLEKIIQITTKSKPKNPVISNHSLSSTTASQ
jgi:hypothetical protein